ncbi:RNA polymerase sigma factor [Actinocorallia lasiicapitis]
MSPPEDDAAVIAASLIDPDRFAEIFDRHADEIHRYVGWRLGADLADDVVSDAFLVAFRKRSAYDLTRSDARPWLFGIASNGIRDHRRAEVRRHRMLARAGFEPQAEPFEERSAERLGAEAMQPRLRAVLAGLSAADRDLLMLIAWAELSYQEAAAALGVPLGTVRSRLHRLRTKLRRSLGGSDPRTTFEEARS